MRISDWSSDVCSSDLTLIVEHIDARRAANRLGDILIGELADRIAGKDGLDRAGRALPRNRARQIGALTDDEDRVGRIAEQEIDMRDAIGGDGRGGADRLGAGIACAHRIGAGGKVGEAETAVRTGMIDAAKLDDFDLGTLERPRSEEHTSELPSLMRNSYAVLCLEKTK